MDERYGELRSGKNDEENTGKYGAVVMRFNLTMIPLRTLLVVLLLLVMLCVVVPVSADNISITTDHDGMISATSANATISTIFRQNGNSVATTGNSGYSMVTAHATADGYYIADQRPFYSFNTSILGSGATIHSVKFRSSYYSTGTTGLGDLTYTVTGANPANQTSFVASDFQTVENIPLTDTNFTEAQYRAGGAANPYNSTLNADGIAFINKTGHTTLTIRPTNDVDNTGTGITWGAGLTSGIWAMFSEYTGTTGDPVLFIDYTPGEAPPDITPPASITNLTYDNTTTCEQITFDWDNPTDEDFNGTEYWLNDVKGTNFTAADGSWILFGGLTGGLEYIFSTRTFDTTGNTNETFINMSAIPTTCTPPDTTPPGAIQGLSNDTTACEQITWGWQSPSDADFNHTMIYRNGVFQYNLSNTTYSDVWSGLTGGQTYEFASHTVDITGNVDPDWMNQSAIVSLCGAAPVVNFTADNTSVCIGDPVWFNDTSEYTPAGAYDDYFEWDFGDGNTTAGFRVDGYNAPTYNYSFAGNKTVILTVTNKYGSDNETKVDYIEVIDCSLTANFTANQTCIIGIPADIQFNSTCDNPGVYKNYWDFGTGDVNNDDQNPVYTYSNYGVFNVTHRCTIGINTTLEEIKTNYIIIGVNGTVCADNCAGSGGGYVGGRDEYPNYLIIGATLGLLFGLIIIRRNEPE